MGSTWPIWVPPSHPFPSEGLKILDTNKTERRWSMAGWLNEWMDGRKEKGDLFMKKWNTVTLVAIFLFSYSAKVCVPGLCPRRMQTCRTECQHFPWYAVVWVTDSFIKIQEHRLKYCNPLLLDVFYLSPRARELLTTQNFFKTGPGVNLGFPCFFFFFIFQIMIFFKSHNNKSQK